jgi:hypothetical protein
MSTLSLEGLVYLADELDRRQIIRLAPSMTVEKLLSHTRCILPETNDQVEIDTTGLPDDVARVFFFYVSEGSATVVLYKANVEGDPDTLTLETSKMILLMDVDNLTSISITATTDNTVYDLFIGGYTSEE